LFKVVQKQIQSPLAAGFLPSACRIRAGAGWIDRIMNKGESSSSIINKPS
jgi:hypothetical protein